MVLADVNVLVYAHREDAPDHAAYRQWLEDVINADHAYGMSELVLSGVIRVVTHPRIFHSPSPIQAALQFVNGLWDQPNCVPITPRERQWGIFCKLCREAGVRGNLVPDAYFAALAIEAGCEWITTDRDYSRFPDLRCRRPLY